ncbi:MAG: tripartite tricarboxylate transporter substrate binding protein [Rubrivivax sp.]|nr:tripartite tricarboxylate transporter substrate binding protein [Rubrivivax sp.]
MRITPCTRRVFQATLLGLALACCGVAHAQTAPWPSKPVKLLVGFPGGSTPDIAARALADALAKTWGQPVVVDNRPGASGNVAADAVAKSSDDHTLGVVINGNLTSAKQLNPKLPYDPAKDFSLISLIATAPLVLVTPADQPQSAAFVAAARAAGDKWSYGSVGIGSVGHLGMELVKAAVQNTSGAGSGTVTGSTSAPNTGAVHVPYNGNPAVLTAMLSGQIQMALVPPGLALAQVKAGKLHAIGLTGPRSALAPEVAPLADSGLKMAPLEVWTALVGPANLSKAALERLARDVPATLREAETRARLFTGGWDVQAISAEGLAARSPSDALAARVASEARLLGDIITSRGIKLE